MNTLLSYILFPVFILSLHWLSVRFYSEFCVPPDLYGYLTSYFTVSSPTCVYALHIVEKTSNIYTVLLSTFSIWSSAAIVQSYKNILNK
jgi:hypothetical protein